MLPSKRVRARPGRKKPKKPAKKNQVAIVNTQPCRFYLLPPELRLKITQEMFTVGGRSLVRDFSFTNRHGYELAQPELYRDIYIQYEVELAHLTRSLIENPSLRKFIRSVSLNANHWCFRRHDSGRIFRQWPDTPMNESHLSQSDRQLLILVRTLCIGKPADNIQFVFGLLLFFIGQAQHLSIDVGYHWLLLDNFLAAGLASFSSSSGPSLDTALLPAVETLNISSKYYLVKSLRTIQARPFHPFKALTASTHLRVFSFTGEMDKWTNLDAIDPDMKLPFTTVILAATGCTASTLCKFLRHCPDLECLEVAPQGWNPDARSKESLDKVLTKFCPQIRELSLRFGGRSGDFFRSSDTKFITCLRDMTNLKELRIELGALILSHSDIHKFRLAEKLPNQLEKLFFDASFSLVHLPFNHLGARMTARSPEAVAYKRAVENVLQGLCKARKNQFPRLNTIVVGAKYVKPVEWTREANKALAKTGARVKVLSSKDTQRLWTYSWDAMRI